ncbi:MAG: hypothetical protein IJA89_08070 [Clostridia bacterium]|nr:hypothetical protein [Clostridia bacterium]
MQKWYWIELIGFDNTQADYGVKAFLERTQAKVDGVSLLFANLEFVVDYQNADGETELLPCHCSYGGYLHGDERDRQVWTNVQLRALVRELHKNGVKVAFSLFDFFSYRTDDGKRVESGFIQAHRELLYLNKNGDVGSTVCPLKRLRSGEYFQDVFVRKLKEVLAYYGFDGVQIADGLSSYRPALQRGDMCDELVSQFVADTKINDSNLAPVGESKKAYQRRRKYIIENLYSAWLQWNSERWAKFYDCLYKAFETEKTELYFNSVWTRDPFEAYLRYGIDYKTTMYKANAIMVEWAAAANLHCIGDNGGVYLPPDKKPDYLYQFALMQQSIKAYMPSVPQYTLSAIKDTFEQWNLMDVAPTEQESVFVSRNHNFVFTGERYENASQGPWYCLSSGVSAEQWSKLNRIETVSGIETVQAPLGFLRVWGDDIRAETKRYLQTHDYSRSQLSYELFASGLCLGGAVRTEHVERVAAPLLVMNPDTLTEAELQSLANTRLPMAIIGTENTVQGATCVYQGKYISVWVKNINVDARAFDVLKRYDAPKACKQTPYLPFDGLWTCPLAYRTLSKTFFKTLAKVLNKAFGLPLSVGKRSDCTINVWKIGEKRYRGLLVNPAHSYNNAEVKMPFALKSVKILNKSRNHKTTVRGDIFYEKVCPRGVSIIEIEEE